MPFLFVLIALALASVHEGCAGLLPEEPNSRDLPCPNAGDILPCVCDVDEAYQMVMHCTYVEEGELARVFSADFPFKHFREIEIRHSYALTILQEGDFGEVSFEEIFTDFTGLTEVQERTFSHSYSTMTTIKLDNNHISKFPFGEIPSFPSLRELYLYGNDLRQFPVLKSDSLVTVSLSFNPIGEIPINGFKDIPYIEDFYFQGNNLQHIYTGTFSGLSNLRRIDLLKNNLRNVQEGAFETSSTSFRELVLTSCNISSIERHAITGLKGGSLWLDGNALTSLEEDVFRPLFNEVHLIYLAGNPLSCSCDIAWLVQKPSLMARVADDAACSNGQLLADLDPAMFDALC
ncbi:oplophorus-luciferin 2-monooxygenase non-catalytic subunit-like [Penaeus chinensis]|uniref:oplophorus-luciferin 2-monooxygenase non-catalytic subunit-like n=1 Tax=Penaeus chinensis TaxID=139456 RepID=UPI001FB5D210|nr:oplophorus-luciferin 2-monooxygenase non-catalytic subunit-like [Penaeus chinensis]